MKNVTIALDDSTYRRVRILAAERELSISGLVKQLLKSLDAPDVTVEKLKARERNLRAQITNFQASERMSRDDAHRRNK